MDIYGNFPDFRMSRMSVGKRIIMSVYPPASPFRTSASDMRDKDNNKILITLNVLQKMFFCV